MSLLTSPKKQHTRKTIRARLPITQVDPGLAEGLLKDLTCNEAEVDALLSNGNQPNALRNVLAQLLSI